LRNFVSRMSSRVTKPVSLRVLPLVCSLSAKLLIAPSHIHHFFRLLSRQTWDLPSIFTFFYHCISAWDTQQPFISSLAPQIYCSLISSVSIVARCFVILSRTPITPANQSVAFYASWFQFFDGSNLHIINPYCIILYWSTHLSVHWSADVSKVWMVSSLLGHLLFRYNKREIWISPNFCHLDLQCEPCIHQLIPSPT